MAAPDRVRVARGSATLPFFPRLVLLALLVLPVPSAASAEAPVRIDVGVVHASNEGSRMDPALESIQGKLRKMFPYTSYRMLDRLKRTLAAGETGEFALPGNRSLRMTHAPHSGGKVRLAVEVNEGPRNLLATTLGLSRGGMVLVGGPSHDRGVLILIISAE